ncbi:parathyroid hormone 2 receptor [Elgaria multicarinata webbii]|uniref:parathyroid hormone 2 receptor n=1 Tax=Elgaria multicarinata webbii TaxID=159646 RepID=UPI002FCCC1C4
MSNLIQCNFLVQFSNPQKLVLKCDGIVLPPRGGGFRVRKGSSPFSLFKAAREQAQTHRWRRECGISRSLALGREGGRASQERANAAASLHALLQPPAGLPAPSYSAAVFFTSALAQWEDGQELPPPREGLHLLARTLGGLQRSSPFPGRLAGPDLLLGTGLEGKSHHASPLLSRPPSPELGIFRPASLLPRHAPSSLPGVSNFARSGPLPMADGLPGAAALRLLAVTGYCFLAVAQEDMDYTITMEDQIYLLLEAKVQCELNITSQLQEGGDCFPEWDGLICWPRGSAGKTLAVPCPSYIYDFNHKGMAFRNCSLNGTWIYVQSLNRTWSNYSECLRFLQAEISPGKREFFERLYIMYTVGYSVSFSSLAVAIFIIGYFRRLHCTRNYIHLHLFVSFMLRATIIFIKDKVVHTHIGVKELDSLLMGDLRNTIVAPGMGKSQYVWCKITVVMFVYFLTTNYYWILVEGLYLHSLIFVAFFSDTKHLWGFILTGWGFPAVFVVAWAVVRTTVADARCWELSAGDIKWIYQAPILVAIGLNFVLFLNTVRVLATKIWETNAVGYDIKKQYRKLAKSTLILILVFGVHYIIFVCLPHTFAGLGWEIQMHCELFFNSFQGFFVSIIYCYCNGEVQTEIKKTWARWNLAMDWKKAAPCGSYRYGSVLTHITHSTSSQSQMVASSRVVLISSRACRSVTRQNDTHVNLPGYVRSNSEQDCVQHWIHEAADEEKKVDAISLRKPDTLQDDPTGSLEEKEEEEIRMEGEAAL